jgi:hypothetical protein
MTTDAQQPQREHPMRCENCSHYGGHICYFQHNRMSNIELTLIEMVGCASHSSTRPHTPAPETQVEKFNRVMISGHTISNEVLVGRQFSAKELYDHDAAIARTATLAELKALYEYAKKNPKGQGFASGVDEWINLRTAQEHP